MKTKLLTGLFFFVSFHLSAQFHLKVNLDSNGLYSVKFKSDVPLNPGSIVGSSQIALTVPKGGFKIGTLTSVKGVWNNNIDFVSEWDGFPFEKDYFFIGLRDGDGIASNGISSDEEITLFTFRNIGKCTGLLELITPLDPFIIFIDSLSKQCPNCHYNNSRNDLQAFDTLAKTVHHFSSVYDIGEAACNPEISELSTNSAEFTISNNFRIFPNPFNHKSSIQFNNPSNKEYQLVIHDLSGRIVRQFTGLTGNQVTIHREEMAAGMYVVQLRDAAGNFATTKIIAN